MSAIEGFELFGGMLEAFGSRDESVHGPWFVKLERAMSSFMACCRALNGSAPDYSGQLRSVRLEICTPSI